MTDFTAEEVKQAFAESYPSDDRLYDEIGWEYYEDEANKDKHVALYLANEYASLEDLLDWSEVAYELRGKNSNHHLVIRGQNVSVYCVEQLGGMDKGTTADVTFKVGDQYFTQEGWYQSHYGYEFDGDFFESTPKEVINIKYERKNK